MAKRAVQGVLALENTQTGDGRVIAAGALTWADLPLPIAIASGGTQHVGLITEAPQGGTIDSVTRVGDEVQFTGTLDDAIPEAAEMIRRMGDGTADHGNRAALSIDPDDWAVQVLVRPEDEDELEQLVAAMSGAGQLPLVAAAGDPDPGDNPDGYTLLFSDDVDDMLERYTRLRITGVTAVPTPAFQGAYMELAVQSAPEGEAAPDQVAAAASTHAGAADSPQAPPAWAFSIPEPDPDTDLDYEYALPDELVMQDDGGLALPFTVLDVEPWRIVYGHVARWGQCHVGYPDQCVTPPDSRTGYAHFHHGSVRLGNGDRIATGPLTLGCDHAAADMRAPDAIDHYAHNGLAFADVRATSGRFGIWVSGVLRPDVTDDQRWAIEASSLSGDWRRLGGHLEMVGALAVNTPGFGIAREHALVELAPAALAASAHWDHGEQVSLVAAGVVQRCPECQRRAAVTAAADSDVLAELAAMRTEMRAGLRTLQLRTRHMERDAAADALDRIRR